MTLNEAIEKVDNNKIGNQIERVEKIAWLNLLDFRIKKEIIDRHCGADGISFEGYDEKISQDVELLASGAYEDLYIYYLSAMIDKSNQETEQFNDNMILFNSTYTAYARDYHRNNMPNQTKIKGV